MYSFECDYEKNLCLEKMLLEKHSLIRRFVITKTVLSRNVTAFVVGRAPKIIYCGAFHGMEHITSMMLYKFLDDVCERMKSDANFYNRILKTGFTLIPMVNPDGVEISCHGVYTAGSRSEFVSECLLRFKLPSKKWQANSRGVDLNHNFDADYRIVKENERRMGILSPSPTRYGGEYPESERETKALCELCRNEKYSLAVALHTQGREIYYDYGENTPKVALSLAEKMAHLSGYRVSHPQGIAVGGGFKDWFIKEFKQPAFTLEIGEGENPLPYEIFDSEYERVSKMLWHLLEYATKNSDG